MHCRQVTVLLCMAIVVWPSLSPAQRRGERLRPQPGELRVGDPAPDFTLTDVNGKNAVTLSRQRGKPVVLIFGSCT